MEKSSIKISEVDSIDDIERLPEDSNIVLDDYESMQDEDFWEE